ncbi:Imm26 family immunity protein [Isoptericola sp. AK164]|uniref:Imm26 family immunity protein n=1 Tax=Isoptericola sp. AK164 TaxID=3024246 RepID=UPI00241876F7|nr:Imm26 family immunity protein [Isoptericola sp. AK164]
MKKLEIGDVFAIPIDEQSSGVGQIVAKYEKSSYYLAIFDIRVENESLPEQVGRALESPVLLLALSLDAKFYAGHWAILSNERVVQSVQLPAYKEIVMAGSGARVDVVDRSGELRRPASPLESETLPNRSTFAPVRLEKALRAHYGIGEWNPDWNRLVADYMPKEVDLFPDLAQ